MFFEALSSRAFVIGGLGFLFLIITFIFSFVCCTRKKEMNQIIKFADMFGGLFVLIIFFWILMSGLMYTFSNNSFEKFYSSICFEAPILNVFYFIWPVLIAGGLVGYIRGFVKRKKDKK